MVTKSQQTFIWLSSWFIVLQTYHLLFLLGRLSWSDEEWRGNLACDETHIFRITGNQFERVRLLSDILGRDFFQLWFDRCSWAFLKYRNQEVEATRVLIVACRFELLVLKYALSVDYGSFNFTRKPHFPEKGLVLRNILESVCKTRCLAINESDCLDACKQVTWESVTFFLCRTKVF